MSKKYTFGGVEVIHSEENGIDVFEVNKTSFTKEGFLNHCYENLKERPKNKLNSTIIYEHIFINKNPMVKEEEI